MISGISSSLSALNAFGNKLSYVARNVANVNTDGYKKTVATITENEQSLPEVTTTRPDTPGPIFAEYGIEREMSNVDLNLEFPQMIISQRGYEANIVSLRTQMDTYKSVLDIFA
jgi:flagellar basal-body rod protein FlgC